MLIHAFTLEYGIYNEFNLYNLCGLLLEIIAAYNMQLDLQKAEIINT